MSITKPRGVNVNVHYSGKPIKTAQRLALALEDAKKIPFARAVLSSLRKDASVSWVSTVLIEAFVSNYLGARDDDVGRARVAALQERLAEAERADRERGEALNAEAFATIEAVKTEQARLDAEYSKLRKELDAQLTKSEREELERLRSMRDEDEKRVANAEREARANAERSMQATLVELRARVVTLTSEQEQLVESKRRLRESLERAKKENEQLRAQLKETT